MNVLPDMSRASTGLRRLFLGLAVVRVAMAILAAVLAPWLYREHAAWLVLLRPTKEVFLFAGFKMRSGDLDLAVAVAAALPLLLPGVWLLFGLGRMYADDLKKDGLPGLAGRILPKRRVDRLREVLDDRGMRVVFLGRLAAFPSALMAAAAGSAGVPWKQFVVADTAGGLVSLAVTLALGYVLGEAYEEAGTWLTVVGVVVLAAVAIMVGRLMLRTPASKSKSKSSS